MIINPSLACRHCGAYRLGYKRPSKKGRLLTRMDKRHLENNGLPTRD